jgi:DNA polymerase-3 subunit gamma/tau
VNPEPVVKAEGSVIEPTAPATPVTLAQLRDAWPEILEVVQKAKRTAWMVVYTSTPRALNDDVLTLSFPSETDVSNFKERPTSGDSVSEQLRAAITTVLGIRVKFRARVDVSAPGPAAEPKAPFAPATPGWNVTPIPGSEEPPPADEPETEPEPEPEPEMEPEFVSPAEESEAVVEPLSADKGDHGPVAPRAASHPSSARYGEAVVRELLGASFLEEQDLAPRDRAVTLEPASDPTPATGVGVGSAKVRNDPSSSAERAE